MASLAECIEAQNVLSQLETNAMTVVEWLFGGRQRAAALALTPARPRQKKTPGQRDVTEDKMVDRNLKGMALEKAGHEAAAAELYEENVSDHFDGSHPYVRLMIIYARSQQNEDAKRVANACLTQATAGLSDEVRMRCAKILGGDVRSM
jgi:hypothetical protein